MVVVVVVVEEEEEELVVGICQMRTQVKRKLRKRAIRHCVKKEKMKMAI